MQSTNLTIPLNNKSMQNLIYRAAKFTQRNIAHARKKIKYRAIYEQFKGHTMISSYVYDNNLELVEKIKDLEGTIVECGVWKGGMIGGIAKLLGNNRHYYLYDSFEGLPEAKEIDGPGAKRWQQDITGPTYYNNCKADYEDAVQAMQIAGVHNFDINKGWFENTLPNYPGTSIALLRIDADWYDSTMTCLESLYKYVSPKGIIIIDDYFPWDGCSRAVHDFLSQEKSVSRIRTFNNAVCWIHKKH